MADSRENPNTIVAVVLGASEWPKAINLSAPESFSKSSSDFIGYLLRRQGGLHIPRRNLLNLFDTPDAPSQIVEAISEFLKKSDESLKTRGSEVKTLIFYYVGHGAFVGDDYVLALRNTNQNLVGAT